MVTTCPSNFADLFNNGHVAGFKIKAKSSNYQPPGFERVSATFKVANTPFHIQSNDITIFRWLLARPWLIPGTIGLLTSRRPCDVIRVAFTILLTAIVNRFIEAVDFYSKQICRKNVFLWDGYLPLATLVRCKCYLIWHYVFFLKKIFVAFCGSKHWWIHVSNLTKSWTNVGSMLHSVVTQRVRKTRYGGTWWLYVHVGYTSASI